MMSQYVSKTMFQYTLIFLIKMCQKQPFNICRKQCLNIRQSQCLNMCQKQCPQSVVTSILKLTKKKTS
jgi:hypothetical protein